MLKIKLLVFGFFIIVIWIFSYSGVDGADWKFLQTNFQGEFSYDAENAAPFVREHRWSFVKNSLFGEI
jgi:uncharacterized membrane protein (Fun14 family)